MLNADTLCALIRWRRCVKQYSITQTCSVLQFCQTALPISLMINNCYSADDHSIIALSVAPSASTLHHVLQMALGFITSYTIVGGAICINITPCVADGVRIHYITYNCYIFLCRSFVQVPQRQLWGSRQQPRCRSPDNHHAFPAVAQTPQGKLFCYEHSFDMFCWGQALSAHKTIAWLWYSRLGFYSLADNCCALI